MRRRLVTLGIPALALAGAVLAGVLAGAGDPVPRPAVAKGRGESCVAETSVMRRDHMRLLEHQRQRTVGQGVRSGAYSLARCLDCHAVPGEDGTPVTFASPRHFCRSCHDYAAVRIDCFECHASRPAGARRARAPDIIESAGVALAAGLEWR